MTVTENRVEIAAPVATIYRLAAATERWPLILPHYRSVRVREVHGATRVVEMACWRDGFPLRWVAEQTNDEATPHIAFRHIAGWTRGMDVEWIFTPLDARRTEVAIVHRLAFRFPLAAEWLGRHLVSDYFIHGVATRTLAHVKRLAESEAP